jgi:hypothetical protein
MHLNTLTSEKLLLQWSVNSVLAADIDLTNYMIEVDDHSEGLEKIITDRLLVCISKRF